LHSYDSDVTSKSTAFFGTNLLQVLDQPNLYLKSNHLQVLEKQVFLMFFFVPGPEKSLQFQDTIGLSSTSSWVLMALNPGYHGRESLTTENVGFGEGGFLF